jgi:predicted Fe-Mo cluster-binding NifX family protein
MTTRIALSVGTDQGLDAPVSAHFGRCPYFTVVEVEGQDIVNVETVTNPYYPNHEPGQVPAFIHSLNANVMLSGGMGGRALAFFRQYGIEPATGAGGTVREAIALYLAGALNDAAPCNESTAHGH